MENNKSRRDFIKKSALALAAISVAPAIGKALTTPEFLEKKMFFRPTGKQFQLNRINMLTMHLSHTSIK